MSSAKTGRSPPSRHDYNEDTDIMVSVILAAPTPGLQKPVRKELTTLRNPSLHATPAAAPPITQPQH